MPYKYNPLLSGKLDLKTVNLNDLEDVNTAGTVNGKVLTFQSGTWIPAAVAGGGDMLISQYVTGQGTVYNASRLEENTLGSVRDHNVVAAKITSGTIGLARIPSIDDARIPNLETLSYGGTFAEAQIPDLPTTKITSGTFGLARIPSIDNAHLAGGITSDKIPALSGTAIAYPINADTVGTTQIIAGGVANAELAASGLDISKFTIGTAGVDRIPSLPAGRITTGTFGLARIPAIDNARIPNLETLSYGGTFAEGQIPNLPTSKIISGTFNALRIPTLPNLIGTLTDPKIPDVETLSYGATFAGAQIPNLGASKITTGTFNANRIPALPTSRITSGTFGIARIPTMDDAHIPDLETLSYGGTFGTAQVPSIGAYKIASGTLNADRIPALPTARITSGTFNSDRIPILPTNRYGSAVLLSGAQTIGGTKTFSDIPILPASDPISANEAARKAYTDTKLPTAGGTHTGTLWMSSGALKDMLYIRSPSGNALALSYGLASKLTIESDKVKIWDDLISAYNNQDKLGDSTHTWKEFHATDIHAYGTIDFQKHQAKAMALEVLGSAPASPATAQMYYNSGDDKVYVYVA